MIGLFFLFFLFLTIAPKPCFAETGAIVERSQELLDEEKALRKWIEEERIFIREIIVEGANLLSRGLIEAITLPYQGQWVREQDIHEIMALLKQFYILEGLPEPDVSYQVEEHILMIQIEEAIL
mgnify:CR=1 FL=1